MQYLKEGAKSVGSGKTTWSNEGERDDDELDTNIIDLSTGEDDLPSINRALKATKQKCSKNPTIADMC